MISNIFFNQASHWLNECSYEIPSITIECKPEIALDDSNLERGRGGSHTHTHAHTHTNTNAGKNADRRKKKGLKPNNKNDKISLSKWVIKPKNYKTH